MIVRNRLNSPNVNWGNGSSHRLLLSQDGMGFALAHTVVTKGTSSNLQYRRHLEACYCIAGSGAVVERDGTRHEVTPGTLYALNEHDAHSLEAGPDEDLVLVSIFNPPIEGTEVHTLSTDGYSQY